MAAITKAGDAVEEFGDKNASASERVRAIQHQLQKAGEDVHTLYGRVKEFMENYSNNDIKFHVKFDAETPAWMKNKSLPELGRLGRFFSALAKDLANSNKSGAVISGKWMSRDEIAQRGYDYTRAADAKQTEKEDQAKKRLRLRLLQRKKPRRTLPKPRKQLSMPRSRQKTARRPRRN